MFIVCEQTSLNPPAGGSGAGKNKKMVGKINGQLVFSCSCPETKIKNRKNKNRFYASLFILMIGIFLLPKIAYLSSITAEKIIELTNAEREYIGINSLTANEFLITAADNKADAIFEAQKFQHNINGEKFSTWIRDAGYKYSYVGENLAIDFLTSEGIIEAWSNSELHNKNLLNPRFKEIGVAAKTGIFNGEDTVVIVQIFGEPSKNKILGKISSIDLNPFSSPLNSISYTDKLNSEECEQIIPTSTVLALQSGESNSSTPRSILFTENNKIPYSKYILLITYIIFSITFILLILPTIFIDAYNFIIISRKLFHHHAPRKHNSGHTTRVRA